MTKEQIEVFNQLLADDSFRGKKSLEHLLWLNTTEPKFKIGECFIVSDPGSRVWGNPVKDFKAIITNIRAFRNMREWQYDLEAEVECEGTHIKVTICDSESGLSRCQRCEGNNNVLPHKYSPFPQSTYA